MESKGCLCLIPARAGSKGIPGKNTAEVGGHPLIWYSLGLAQALREAGLADKALVSSDIAGMEDILREFPLVEMPFIRPASLADDHAKTVDVVLHTLDWCREYWQLDFSDLLLLQPTTPLRIIEDVQGALKLFQAHPEAVSLISVYEEKTATPVIMYRREGEYGSPLVSAHSHGRRRQDEAAVYVRNGAIYLVKTFLIRQQGRLFDDAPLLWEMPRDRSINVDSPEDMEYLRWKISQ